MLPFGGLMAWLVYKGRTSRLVLYPDAVAVASAFGEKRLNRDEIAGIQLVDGAYRAVEGTSLAWLQQKGTLALIRKSPRGGRLYLPVSLKADATFDEWFGGLRLGGTEAEAPTVREASHQAALTETTTTKPILTVSLLAALVAGFAIEIAFPVGPSTGLNITPLTQISFGSLMGELVHKGQWFRLVSAIFLHGNLMHLLMNGLVLFFIGMRLEGQIGRLWLAALFLFSGVGGSLMSLAAHPPLTNSVGASGAIMGLLAGAFVLSFHQPVGQARTQIRLGILRLLIPALIPSASRAHIDFAAHFGGAVAGATLALLLVSTWTKSEPRPRLRRLAMAIIAGVLLITPVGLRDGIVSASLFRAEAGASPEEALAAYTRAIATMPNDVGAYNERGVLLFTRGLYAEAAEDFRTSIRLDPAWGYNALLLHLARAHAGVDDREELALNEARMAPAVWPSAVMRMFTGKLSPDALPGVVSSTAADSKTAKDQLCEATYYTGEYEVLHGRADRAKDLFGEAAKTCPSDFIEYRLAKAELARLGSP